MGDQGQGAYSEGAASPHGTGQQFRDRGQRNPGIEASASLPRNASYDKSAEYSIERPLHLSVERIAYFTEPVLHWAAPPNPELAQTDILIAWPNVRFWGNSGHRKFTPPCPLMTQSGHRRA